MAGTRTRDEIRLIGWQATQDRGGIVTKAMAVARFFPPSGNEIRCGSTARNDPTTQFHELRGRRLIRSTYEIEVKGRRSAYRDVSDLAPCEASTSHSCRLAGCTNVGHYLRRARGLTVSKLKKCLCGTRYALR